MQRMCFLSVEHDNKTALIKDFLAQFFSIAVLLNYYWLQLGKHLLLSTPDDDELSAVH